MIVATVIGISGRIISVGDIAKFRNSLDMKLKESRRGRRII